MSDALRVCGMPYLMPTPTRGSAFTTFFTVDWSENANIMDAAREAVDRILEWKKNVHLALADVQDVEN